eukprot:jgi/Picre1/34964/NNA_002430.t1
MNNSVPGTSLEVDSSGVGVITLRNPPVNALHPKVLQNQGKFCAGFDINQFVEGGEGGGIDGRINDAFVNLLENGPKPSVAAIQGLALGVAEPRDLMRAAKQLALDIAEGRHARVMSLFRTDRVGTYEEAMAVLDFARAQSAKKARGLQHPLLCIDAIQYGIEHGGLEGLKKESECFDAAAALDTHKALVHIFFAQRSTKKVQGITDQGLRRDRSGRLQCWEVALWGVVLPRHVSCLDTRC